MRRSNRNFKIPQPGKPRAFDPFLCPGSGEFDRQGRSEAGELTFTWTGRGKLNRKCQVSNDVFLPGAEVYGRDGKIKGRDITCVRDWCAKKGLEK